MICRDLSNKINCSLRSFPLSNSKSSFLYIAASEGRYVLGEQFIPESPENVFKKSAAKAIKFPPEKMERSPVESYEDGIQQLALLLTKMPELSIKLIGHADIRGNRDYNIKLSERRAKAVKSILTDSYSIDPTRFYIEYKGKDSPHTEHISQAAQGSNRRVEIRLMYKGKEITE
jgi:outer membrane protein OmpA-like peptidoglycan-associated protein